MSDKVWQPPKCPQCGVNSPRPNEIRLFDELIGYQAECKCGFQFTIIFAQEGEEEFKKMNNVNEEEDDE